MNIGTAAAKSGVPAKTIRYYEAIGLIPPARRSGNNYRHYSEQDVQTLLFVQRARGLGFSVNDVRNLLELWRNDHRSSKEVKALATRHVEDIERKIRELQSIRDTLLQLTHRCHGDERPDCPILEDLASAAAS